MESLSSTGLCNGSSLHCCTCIPPSLSKVCSTARKLASFSGHFFIGKTIIFIFALLEKNWPGDKVNFKHTQAAQ